MEKQRYLWNTKIILHLRDFRVMHLERVSLDRVSNLDNLEE